MPPNLRVTTGTGHTVTDNIAVAGSVTTGGCEPGSAEIKVDEYAACSVGLQTLGNGYYRHNWKTSTSYQDSCKLLSVDLGDDVPQGAQSHFTN